MFAVTRVITYYCFITKRDQSHKPNLLSRKNIVTMELATDACGLEKFYGNLLTHESLSMSQVRIESSNRSGLGFKLMGAIIMRPFLRGNSVLQKRLQTLASGPLLSTYGSL